MFVEVCRLGFSPIFAGWDFGKTRKEWGRDHKVLRIDSNIYNVSGLFSESSENGDIIWLCSHQKISQNCLTLDLLT